jgi:hypothetical protein
MSQGRAKRERREARLRERLEGTESALRKAPEEKRPAAFGMLRGKASSYIKTGAAVAALAAGGLFVWEQMPYWTGAKPRYAVEMVFLNHDNPEHGVRLGKEMEAAASSGKPFELMFCDQPGEKSSQYDSDVRNANADLAKRREAYMKLRKGGWSEGYAEVEVLKDGRMSYKDPSRSDLEGQVGFMNIAFTKAAELGVDVLPIESYSDSKAAELYRVAVQEGGVNERILQLGRDSTLGDMKGCVMELGEANRYIFYRNEQIARSMEDRLDRAVRLFPKLWLDELEGKQIRAIAWLGNGHVPGQLMEMLQRNDADKRVEFTGQYWADEHMLNVYDTVMTQMGKPRQFTELEAFQIAIELKWIGSAEVELGVSGNSLVARRLVDNTLSMTLDQCIDLDKQTSMLKDPQEKIAFALNTIYGENVFIQSSDGVWYYPDMAGQSGVRLLQR